MDIHQTTDVQQKARRKFLALSLESTRKSYYPQLQKQLASIKHNEKKLQLLIDNMPAQISYINSKEQYVSVNQAFEKEVGLNRDQIIGRSMKEILGKTTYNQLKSHIDNALSGESGHLEFSVTTKKKEVKWYGIDYVTETDTSSATNNFYVLTIDLTAKKSAEEEKLKLKDRLRQSQKMEAIGTLSGGIAHDFNNILSGIFGYSQMIDANLNNPDQVKEYNNKIFQGAQRAASLIQQILSFSRQTKYNKQPLCLFTILNEAIPLIRSTIPANIDIKTTLNTNAMILADAIQIHQVVINLCTNAYHAMADEGGVLSIDLNEVQLTQEQKHQAINYSPDKYLKLDISDTGPGIEDLNKEKIFDPYFTTKAMGKGTGLGLAIVSGIVQKHNGFIEFDTQIGVGTTFHLYLPMIEDRKPRKVEAKKKKSLKMASGKIMLIDDEPAILDTFSAILSRQGYQITSFENGESALDAFAKNPNQFDLIITDMTMPKMTGDKLSKEILKIREDIPIILCSGYHENFTETDALQAGIKRYVQKPIAGSDLTRIIQELLNVPRG
jgi:PAS domain S-box-containing protein